MTINAENAKPSRLTTINAESAENAEKQVSFAECRDPERRAQTPQAVLNGPFRPMPSAVTVSVRPSSDTLYVPFPSTLPSTSAPASIVRGSAGPESHGARRNARNRTAVQIDNRAPPAVRDDRRRPFRDRLAILDAIRHHEIAGFGGFEPQACLLRRVGRDPTEISRSRLSTCPSNRSPVMVNSLILPVHVERYSNGKRRARSPNSRTRPGVPVPARRAGAMSSPSCSRPSPQTIRNS